MTRAIKSRSISWRSEIRRAAIKAGFWGGSAGLRRGLCFIRWLLWRRRSLGGLVVLADVSKCFMEEVLVFDLVLYVNYPAEGFLHFALAGLCVLPAGEADETWASTAPSTLRLSRTRPRSWRTQRRSSPNEMDLR